jgi:serine/threonine protein kinase
MGTPLVDAASVAVDASMVSATPSLAEALTIGSHFAGRFTILSKLGAGGQGSVYEARDESSGVIVAIKIPRPDRAAKRMEREIAALRAIQHEGVVAMIECSSEAPQRHLVMERAGPTLADIARLSPTHRINSRAAGRIGLEALLAIEACHRAGFLHRDIKPSNIALATASADSGVKVLDLGLAVRSDRPARRRRRFVGTARYASTSTLSGNAHTPTDDLIGLWLTLLHLVAGSLPWERTATRTHVRKLHTQLMSRPLPPALPPEFETMRRALAAHDTSTPYAAFVRALDALAAKTPATFRPVDWTSTGLTPPSLRATMDAAAAWRRAMGTSQPRA